MTSKHDEEPMRVQSRVTLQQRTPTIVAIVFSLDSPEAADAFVEEVYSALEAGTLLINFKPQVQ